MNRDFRSRAGVHTRVILSGTEPITGQSNTPAAVSWAFLQNSRGGGPLESQRWSQPPPDTAAAGQPLVGGPGRRRVHTLLVSLPVSLLGAWGAS